MRPEGRQNDELRKMTFEPNFIPHAEGSVLVSFAIGAWILKEKNLKSTALDLGLLLLSMVFLYLGSR